MSLPFELNFLVRLLYDGFQQVCHVSFRKRFQLQVNVNQHKRDECYLCLNERVFMVTMNTPPYFHLRLRVLLHVTYTEVLHLEIDNCHQPKECMEWGKT